MKLFSHSMYKCQGSRLGTGWDKWYMSASDQRRTVIYCVSISWKI